MEKTKISSPDAVVCMVRTSSEVSAPDDPGAASAQLVTGRNLIIGVHLLIPTPGIQDNLSDEHFGIAVAATNEDGQVNLLTKSYLARLNVTDDSETAVAATSEDLQVNLLTKSYLARLNVTDDSEDDDLEEYERVNDDPMFLSAIQETVNN